MFLCRCTAIRVLSPTPGDTEAPPGSATVPVCPSCLLRSARSHTNALTAAQPPPAARTPGRTVTPHGRPCRCGAGSEAGLRSRQRGGLGHCRPASPSLSFHICPGNVRKPVSQARQARHGAQGLCKGPLVSGQPSRQPSGSPGPVLASHTGRLLSSPGHPGLSPATAPWPCPASPPPILLPTAVHTDGRVGMQTVFSGERA